MTFLANCDHFVTNSVICHVYGVFIVHILCTFMVQKLLKSGVFVTAPKLHYTPMVVPISYKRCKKEVKIGTIVNIW